MEKHILVVDDEPDIIKFISRLLQNNGYKVATAQNGIEAMEAIKKDRPSLILLDLQMPHDTGTDLYRKLRHDQELKKIPVIVVSGFAGRRVAVSKSVPVIDKPIDEQRLLSEVEKVMGDGPSPSDHEV